jgi:hypothetical protein
MTEKRRKKYDFINEKLKKEFTRYKRYLVLKRKRANRFNIKKGKNKCNIPKQ